MIYAKDFLKDRRLEERIKGKEGEFVASDPRRRMSDVLVLASGTVAPPCPQGGIIVSCRVRGPDTP